MFANNQKLLPIMEKPRRSLKNKSQN